MDQYGNGSISRLCLRYILGIYIYILFISKKYVDYMKMREDHNNSSSS